MLYNSNRKISQIFQKLGEDPETKKFKFDSPAEFYASIRPFVFPEASSILLLTQVSQEKLGKWSREEFENEHDDRHGIS